MDKIYWAFTTFLFIADLAIRIGLSLRVIMRKRAASVSLAWLVVILLLPFVGAIIYLLLGENRLGEHRAKRAAANLPIFKDWLLHLQKISTIDWEAINPECEPIHRQIDNVFSIPALQGNELQLIDTSDLFFDNLLQDIRSAQQFCYLQFYIMAPGGRVDEVVRELIKAAAKGVICRVMVDSIGSKEFLHSLVPDRMRRAGIEVLEVLPAGVFRSLFVRIDLRNHRKMVIIDNKISYTGSQNLVDPRFFKQDSGVGEWKDTMVRIRGPLIETMTAAFIYNWVLETGSSIDGFQEKKHFHSPAPAGDAVIQMLPSGPGFEENSIHDLLLTTIYAARKELVLTTPYFVPDNAILTALTSASLRGVEVTIVVPFKNDSKLVHYASQAMYGKLIDAGIKIVLFTEGLLHAKTITVDSEFCLFGSVNLDMRSFWLNFEMTLFIYDQEFTRRLRNLQQHYISESHPLDHDAHRNRSFGQRFKENCALLVGPLL